MASVRRVVVSGIGLVTSLGTGLERTRRGLAEGRSAFGPPTSFDASAFACQDAAEVRDFAPRDFFRFTKAVKLTDRTTRFAVAAATMALADAGWPDESDESAEDVGVVIGSSGSDLQLHEIAKAIGSDDRNRAVHDIPFFSRQILADLHPLWLLVNLPNMASAHVAIQLGARGPNSTIMTDWVAGSQAIGEAFDWIRNGEADAVLAGGADSGLQPLAYAACEQSGLFADASRPGTGFVPAEGAAVLLLEEREHALARGAPVRGEMRAYSTAGDSTGSEASRALADTLTSALDAANWRTDQVSILGLASICSPRYEEVERQALEMAFGRADTVPTTSHTSILGHAFGAAGAIDAAILLDRWADAAGGILCSAIGQSGQAVTIGFQPASSR